MRRWDLNLEAEITALKEAEKQRDTRSRVALATNKTMPVQSPELTAGSAAVTAVVVFISANLIMVMAMGLFNSGNTFTYFWPAELTLMAAGLFYIMKPTRNIWLMIPAGSFLGLSVLFTFPNFLGAWHVWAFIWPLVIFLVMGTIWWSMKWAGHGEVTRRKAYATGHLFSRISYGFVIFIGFVSIPFGH